MEFCNDGAGSGLDADLLDGQQGSYYVNTSTAQSIAGVKSFSGKIGADGGIDGLTNANGISGSNFNITGVNVLQINDPGEAIEFNGTTTVYLDVIDDAVDDKLRIRNATQLDLNSTARITNLVDPSGAQDAATKTYVDTAVGGVSSGVTSVATTNGITGGTITSTGTIQVDDTVARVYKGTSGNVSSSAYKTAFTVNGGNLSSHIRFSVQGTASNVVISNLIDLAVNHYQDIQLTALSGNYTRLSVKVISNNNEDYEVQFKTNSTNAVTLYLEVFPLGSETITFTSTSSFTGTTGTFADLPYGNYMNGTGGDEGDLFIGGNFTVQGGDIVLNGTGRVQGIDTVSATTDAANKTYVDTAVAGAGSGTFLPLAGGTMDSSALIGGSGTLELGGSGVTNLLLDSDGINIMQFVKASASLQYAQIISNDDKVRLRFRDGMDIYYDDTAIVDYMKFHALGGHTTQFKNDNFEIIGIGTNNDEMLF